MCTYIYTLYMYCIYNNLQVLLTSLLVLGYLQHLLKGLERVSATNLVLLQVANMVVCG